MWTLNVSLRNLLHHTTDISPAQTDEELKCRCQNHMMKRNEDDSSSHKTTGYVGVFLSLLKDNTHSVAQLNLPSSWLIFFVHCVIGYKMVDSRDIFQLFNITTGKGHPRVSCCEKRTHLCCISWQLLMVLKRRFFDPVPVRNAKNMINNADHHIIQKQVLTTRAKWKVWERLSHSLASDALRPEALFWLMFNCY